jgi:hypothetical protein
LPFNAWFNPSYAGSFAPVTQNLELLNASRNVTNISASKTLISSFGPRVEFIAQQTGRQLKTYTLHYSEVRGRNNFSRSINGNLLNVNGPVAKLKANATKVPTVIKTIVRPTVNKGWNGFTKDEIDGVHRKYASEAHIPSHLPTKPIERVNLVPSGMPTPIQLVHNQKEKEAKPGKETVKSAAEKGSKGKIGAGDRKTTGKHKTASKEEGSSKGEGKSKSSKGTGGSKGSSASKSKIGSGESKSKDDDESKTAKKGSTSKSGSKKDNGSDDSSGSKSGGGSKGSGSKGGGSSKREGAKSRSKSSSEEKKDE